MGSLAGLGRIVMGTAKRRTRRALSSLFPIMKSHSSPKIVLAFSRTNAAVVNDGTRGKARCAAPEVDSLTENVAGLDAMDLGEAGSLS